MTGTAYLPRYLAQGAGIAVSQSFQGFASRYSGKKKKSLYHLLFFFFFFGPYFFSITTNIPSLSQSTPNFNFRPLFWWLLRFKTGSSGGGGGFLKVSKPAANLKSARLPFSRPLLLKLWQQKFSAVFWGGEGGGGIIVSAWGRSNPTPVGVPIRGENQKEGLCAFTYDFGLSPPCWAWVVRSLCPVSRAFKFHAAECRLAMFWGTSGIIDLLDIAQPSRPDSTVMNRYNINSYHNPFPSLLLPNTGGKMGVPPSRAPVPLYNR